MRLVQGRVDLRQDSAPFYDLAILVKLRPFHLGAPTHDLGRVVWVFAEVEDWPGHLGADVHRLARLQSTCRANGGDQPAALYLGEPKGWPG